MLPLIFNIVKKRGQNYEGAKIWARIIINDITRVLHDLPYK